MTNVGSGGGIPNRYRNEVQTQAPSQNQDLSPDATREPSAELTAAEAEERGRQGKAFLGGAAPSASSTTVHEDDVQTHTGDLATLPTAADFAADIANIQSRVASLQSAVGGWNADISQLQINIAELQKLIIALYDDRADLQNRLRFAETLRNRLNAELASVEIEMQQWEEGNPNGLMSGIAGGNAEPSGTPVEGDLSANGLTDSGWGSVAPSIDAADEMLSRPYPNGDGPGDMPPPAPGDGDAALSNVDNFFAQHHPQGDQNTDPEAMRAALASYKEALEGMIAEVDAEIDHINDQITIIDEQIPACEAQIAVCEAQVEELEAKIAQAEEEIERLQAQIEQDLRQQEQQRQQTQQAEEDEARRQNQTPAYNVGQLLDEQTRQKGRYRV